MSAKHAPVVRTTMGPKISPVAAPEPTAISSAKKGSPTDVPTGQRHTPPLQDRAYARTTACPYCHTEIIGQHKNAEDHKVNASVHGDNGREQQKENCDDKQVKFPKNSKRRIDHRLSASQGVTNGCSVTNHSLDKLDFGRRPDRKAQRLCILPSYNRPGQRIWKPRKDSVRR